MSVKNLIARLKIVAENPRNTPEVRKAAHRDAEGYTLAIARRAEWTVRSENVAGFPYVVVYQDRATFPACDYFPSMDAARAAADARPWVNVQERRLSAQGSEESRLILGVHPI